MTDKREESRQRWEQEIHDRQQNVTPADYPEGLRYARVEGIPRIASKVRFWIGIVLTAVGVSTLRSMIPEGAAIASIAVGLYVAITAMRWNDRQ